MTRIETRRIRRLLRAHAVAAMRAAGRDPTTTAALAPESPRAIARRMALEGAALLARGVSPSGQQLPADAGDATALSRPRHGPFAGFRPVRPIIAGLAFCMLASGAAAQVSSASPAALGLGENFTAAARGVDAVAWNPAALGLRSEGGSSFVVLTIRGLSGIEPVTPGNLAEYSDVLVPDGVKRDWLSRIAADGGQVGTGGADVTWLGLQLGPLALHASSAARMTADVSPGIAELLLFGNVGQTGEARSLDLSGSSLQGFAFSALGASLARAVPTDQGQVSLGVTIKYVLGHGLAMGDNSSGSTTVDPLAVDVVFPLVHTDFDSGAYGVNNGSGIGVDVGASLQSGDWTLSAVVQNVANGFAWDVTKLRYRPLALALSQNRAVTETADVPLSSAPAAIRARVTGFGFEPVWAAGAAWQYTPDLLFTADARFTSADGLLVGPSRHVGGGFEYRHVDRFPLRLGGALISMGDGADGWQLGAGFGLDLGIWQLAASALRRNAGRFGNATALMVSLVGAGR